MNPLLSIVIPTRNRQQYCIAAIDNILSYNYSSLELCIQDNSDDNQIEQYVAARKVDIRLKYCHICERLNSVHNMDQAISMATGKYVTMIGDDDTVLPNIFNIVDWADKNGVDSICARQTVAYYWPGAYPKEISGVLMITSPDVKRQDNWDIERKLTVLFKKGITRFLDYKLPKLYHGLILNDRLQEIRKRAGHYFGGLSPDIYSTIALCGVVKNHAVIDGAITVSGACRSSATSQNINLGHRGELSEAPHLILRGPYVWDDYIPAYYSVETIWAESALKAVVETGMIKFRDKFDYSYLVAFAALNNRNIFSFAMNKSLSKDNHFVINDSFLKVKILISFIKIACGYFLRKLTRRFNKSEATVVYRNVENISHAVELINRGE